MTVFFRLLLAIPHLIVVALWGLRGARRVGHPLARAPLRGQGAALAAGVRRLVPALLRARQRLPLPGRRPVSAVRRRRGLSGRSRDRAVRAPVAAAASRRGSCSRSRCSCSLRPSVAESWFVNTSWATSQDTGAGWSTGWSVGGLAATAAFLAWFASLARGRTPRGLRDLVVYAIGYTAQVVGYLLLVTDRYPTSRPGADRARHRPAPASGAARAHRPPRAVAAHRLLPAPARRSRT